MKKGLLLLAVFTFVLFAQVRTNRTTTTEKPVANDNIQTENTENKLEFYPTMGYQGLLKDNEGKLVADGTYKVSFKIYESSESKESIWKETQDVEIIKGIINCYIGAEEKLNLPFDKQYWLSVSVGDDELPRMIMSGTPYSLHARRIAEDAIIGGKNISVSKDEDGKIVLSGEGASSGSKALTNLDNTLMTDASNAYGVKSINSYNSSTNTGMDENVLYQGIYSYALGKLDSAFGDYSLALGYKNKARGDASLAIGWNTVALGDASISLGYLNKARGNFSLAGGYSSIASGLYSFGFGREVKATGDASFASGYNSEAEGGGSTALGMESKATGLHSFTGGYFCESLAEKSFSLGTECKILPKDLVPTDSDPHHSFCMGYKMNNYYNDSFMIGFDPASCGYSSLFVTSNKVCIGFSYDNIAEIYDSNYNSMLSLDRELLVNGRIVAMELNLQTEVWADYVFKDDYQLKPLSEVEDHIRNKGHLPGIIPEKEALEKGVNVGDVQVKLLEKIEELTLYIIEQDKRIKELEKVK